MSISEHTPADDPCYYSNPLAERLKQYVDCQVLKYTGLSFDEFLDRPRDEVTTILETLGQIINNQPKVPEIPDM